MTTSTPWLPTARVPGSGRPHGARRFDRTPLIAAIAVALAGCVAEAPAPANDVDTDPAEGLQIRVAIDRPAYAPGSPIQVRIEAVNRLEETRTLSFRDGQRVDAILEDEEGREVARWSTDRMFAQALGEEVLEPGDEGLGWDLELEAPEAAGSYRLRGLLTAVDLELEATVPVEVTGDGNLGALWDAALDWPQFFAGIEARRAIWERNWNDGQVPPELLERARDLGGSWRVLAITEDACSDSVNTVPYIALLLGAMDDAELRIVDSELGRPWMEAHRSADGRAATPTVLVLDEADRLVGCWIEQPVALQAFWLDVVARNAMSEEVGRKMAWYDEDAGRETLREFVEVLEAARSGDPVCPGLTQATVPA
jgi:hypothetical protein